MPFFQDILHTDGDDAENEGKYWTWFPGFEQVNPYMCNDEGYCLCKQQCIANMAFVWHEEFDMVYVVYSWV